MGAFFKTLANSKQRNISADKFRSDYNRKFITVMPDEIYKCYKSCLLSIFAGSNKGSIEDCVRILNRNIDSVLNNVSLSNEKKRYFIWCLKQECFDGNTEKYGYWWARKMLDETLNKL